MIVAWQGWRIEVPEQWGPVKVEGDADQGYLLMADLHRPRLGVRWTKESGKRFNAEASARKAMVGEVGDVAGDRLGMQAPSQGQWLAPLLYVDPESPGRDVWIGYSQTSSRMFQVVYHAHQRDAMLTQSILPSLQDASPSGAVDWSIFDLSCRTPEGWSLVKRRLNAGDLSLWFTGPEGQVATVRQIGVAKLALQRRPLERWIEEQAGWRGRHYRVTGTANEVEGGLRRMSITRRRRFFFMFWLPRGHVAVSRHDIDRNKLVIVDASTEEIARRLIDTVGWAGSRNET